MSVAAIALSSMPSGCRSDGRIPKSQRAPLPAFAQLASSYNERIERLSTVWSRAGVGINFVDEQGRKRYEQGDGHLQVKQPDHLALSLGKLGNLMIWIGSDGSQYWLLDREAARAVVGDCAALVPEQAESLGLAVSPLELIALLGITPIPADAESEVRWSKDGRAYVIEHPTRSGLMRYEIETGTLHARLIEILAPGTREAAVSASLTEYRNVSVQGIGGFPPRMATLITINDPSSDSTIKLTLDAMRVRTIDPDVFRLPFLLDAYGPFEVIRAADVPSNRTAPDRSG